MKFFVGRHYSASHPFDCASHAREPSGMSYVFLQPGHSPQWHVRLELRNVVANYPFERSHRFPGIQPNSGRRDCSRLSCGCSAGLILSAALIRSGGSGRFQNKCEMKLPWDPRLRELVALAVLAAFGCGLALSQGDLLFVAIFGAACAVTLSRRCDVCGERWSTRRVRSRSAPCLICALG